MVFDMDRTIQPLFNLYRLQIDLKMLQFHSIIVDREHEYPYHDQTIFFFQPEFIPLVVIRPKWDDLLVDSWNIMMEK